MRAVTWLTGLALCGVVAAGCENASTVNDSYYRLQMETDLLNLIEAQDAYFLDSLQYTSSTTALRYNASYGVTVTIISANATGWSATAKHFDTQAQCGVFAGNAAPPVPGAIKREPACP